MCNPAAALLAIQAGQSVVSYVSQKAEAKGQEALIDLKANTETNHAVEEAGVETTLNLQELRRSRATSEALAEAGGIAGNSVYAQDSALVFQSGQKQEITTTRLKNNLEAIEANRASNKTSIKRPSLLSTGLQIGSSIASYKNKTTGN